MNWECSIKEKISGFICQPIKLFYVLLTLAYRPKILSLKIEKIEIFKFISKITFLLIYITSLTFLSRLIASFCFRGTFTWILLWASSETPKQTNLGFFEKLTFLVCVFFSLKGISTQFRVTLNLQSGMSDSQRCHLKLSLIKNDIRYKE